MKTKLKTEITLLTIALVPYVYLAVVWSSLPNTVPIHWNVSGEADRYGNKLGLIVLTTMLSLLPYLSFLFMPRLDRQHQLEKMGGKYDRLRFSLTLLMSVLTCYVVYMVKNGASSNPNLLLGIIGLLFAICGNYFQVLRPNRFIGIRTPWTLKNETVWTETHKVGGKYFLIGGLLIICASFVISGKLLVYAFLLITLLIILIPTLFSYLIYRKLGREKG